MSNVNGVYGSGTTISPDLEDRIMSALPVELANWLRFDAVSDFSPIEVFRLWRDGNEPLNIMSQLRGMQRKGTRKIYGADHPQASLF